MRVAIFSDSLPPRLDGIAVAVQQLAVSLVESGHQVLIVGPGDPLAGGIPVLHLPSVPTPLDGYRLAVPLRSRMSRVLRRFGPDVVSAQTVGPIGLIGLSLARRQGVPALFSWHTDFEMYGRIYRVSPRLLSAGSYLPFVLAPTGGPRTERPSNSARPQPTPGLIPASLRRASGWMSAVCAPSSGAAEQVRRFGLRSPVYVLPTAVTAEDLGVGSVAARRALRSLPGAGATPYLLFVGRLSREKNLELLIDAFGQGVPAPARLVLVGPANDARQRAMLAARAAQLPDRIVLTGPLARAELGEIYRSAVALVTPSRSETQCLSVSEAVALAVPVIVVDPQLARDRPPGTVRVTAPDPLALAEAMTDRLRAWSSERRAGGPVPPAESRESLGFRFAAAAESVGRMPAGVTLRWHEGRWITS